jgi:hypothetical protein
VTFRRPKKAVERFPGFAACIAMLRNRKDVDAQEAGDYWLVPRVGEFVVPLLAELDAESDLRMQGWLLELLGDARDVRAFPAFVRYLLSADESVRNWAEWGLRKLGQTRDGRKVLWGVHQQLETALVLPTASDESRS